MQTRPTTGQMLADARKAADEAVYEQFGKGPGNFIYGSAPHDYWRMVFEASAAAQVIIDRLERGVA